MHPERKLARQRRASAFCQVVRRIAVRWALQSPRPRQSAGALLGTVRRVNWRKTAAGAVVGAAVIAGGLALIANDHAGGHLNRQVLSPGTTVPIAPGTVGPPVLLAPTTSTAVARSAKSPTGTHHGTAPPDNRNSAAQSATSNPPPTAATTTTLVSLHGQPRVTWELSGSCQATRGTFSCRATVTASNGLESAGYVEFYPNSGYGAGCEQYGALVHDSVTITGSCSLSLEANVLAVYSVTPEAGPGSKLAAGLLPWA